MFDEPRSSDGEAFRAEMQPVPDPEYSPVSDEEAVPESDQTSEVTEAPTEDAMASEAGSNAKPPADTPKEATETDAVGLEQIGQKLDGIANTEQCIFSEVREMHKLYHTEFAGRLKSMQDELEQYRKIEKGRVYDDILAAIARIYGNNETLADEVAEPKAKKSIKYMLLDLEDLLEVYGMGKLRSAPGEKRNPRHCQILNRIPTDDPEKHDTVAKSYNSGFYIGNRTVIKELVDIYFFESPAANIDTEITETADGSDSE